MKLRDSVLTVAACTVLFAAVGGGIGFFLGKFHPGYYRAVFRAGREEWFEPVSVGIGQGLPQGAFGGALIGLILVVLEVWRESRLKGLASGTARPHNADPSAPPVPAAPAAPPYAQYTAGIVAPWLAFSSGVLIVKNVQSDRAAFGLSYIVLIIAAGLTIIAGIWGIVIMAQRRYQPYNLISIGYIAACVINFLSFGAIGGH